ncbi:MAG: flagellar basal-body MS-ring/collar protein FliF [bacterium]|nr:flagellar basal-body MS-ring/collar protein FliF [bacterium]
MPEWLSRFAEQIKGVWGGLNRAQKAILIGVTGFVFVALTVLIFYVSRPEWVILYSRLDPAEAGRITAKLADWKQPYKLEETTILVPVKDKDRIRLRLAAEELAPTGGIVTFDIFDKIKLTTTDYERRVNFLRALQGELTRTIESIEPIESARVMIVMPEKKLYLEEEEPVTASIKLKLKPYAQLTSGQVKGIVNLAASAVEGLTPENVTVVDNKGNILSDLIKQEGEMTTLTANQLELQKGEGKVLERKIRHTLGQVLGQDKVEAIVKCEMDFDRVESRAERYSMPGFEQLKVSEEKVDEHFEGKGATPGGPPGVEANIPGYKGVEKVGPMQYDKKEERINYLADKEDIVRIRSPYVSRISVAVFIDGSYERDKEGKLKLDEEGKPIYIPRTKEEMQTFEELVWAAIGSEKGKTYKDREYIVKVKNVQFDRTEEWAQELEEKRIVAQRRILSLAIIGALVFLVGIVALVRWQARKKRERLEEEARRRELEREAALRAVEEEELVKLPPEERERIELQQRTERIAKEKPELVADLVRTWMAEVPE